MLQTEVVSQIAKAILNTVMIMQASHGSHLRCVSRSIGFDPDLKESAQLFTIIHLLCNISAMHQDFSTVLQEIFYTGRARRVFMYIRDHVVVHRCHRMEKKY